MLNIVVLGAPCSGKGTQSEKIATTYDLTHLSTGDHFRNEIKLRTPVGLLAQSFIDKGELVPDSIVLKEIYRKAIKKIVKKGIVFDGFPRTEHQAQMLQRSLHRRNLSVSLVIYIDVDESELINRMLNRCHNSALRSDDNAEIFQNRITVYKNQTLPLLEYYSKRHKLTKISGMASVEEVFTCIKKAIDAHLND